MGEWATANRTSAKRGGRIGDNVGGVDLRRPRHVTLPAQRTTASADNDPGVTAQYGIHKGGALALVPTDFSFQPTINAIIGVGDSVYTSTLGGPITSLVRRQVLTQYQCVVRVVEFTGSDGNRFVYLCGRGADPNTPDYYRGTIDGVTWVASSAIPTSGVTSLGDMIVLHDQIIATDLDNGQRIISSADGINWTTDLGEDPVYRPKGNIRFIGIAMGPLGNPVIYALENGQLMIVDFYIKDAYPVRDVGDRYGLWEGTVWGGSVWVTDGYNIFQYNPGNASTVRYMGPFGKQGVPPSWASTGDFTIFSVEDDSYRVIEFFSGGSDLFAVCRRTTDSGGSLPGNDMRLLVYNGTGWSWYGPEISGAIPHAGVLHGNPVQEYGRELVVISTAREDPEDTTITKHRWRLPLIEGTPLVRWKEAFEDGPLSFETGWMDGGFSDLEGALLRLQVDGYNITPDNTILVEYRLNNNEQGTYRTLATFTAVGQEVWFADDHRGVAFKSVQFRVSLDRGASGILQTQSPELRALILLFDKKPRMRTAWTIRIAVSRTVERGLLLNPEEPATTEGIWQFLKSLVNTPRLIKLEIPSMESGGVNVRITDMPATIAEFRAAKGGEGFVELQLIEPAGP